MFQNVCDVVLTQGTRRVGHTATTCTTWISWCCTPTTRQDVASTTSTTTFAARCLASTTPSTDHDSTFRVVTRSTRATCTSRREASPTDTADYLAQFSARSWYTSDVTGHLSLNRKRDCCCCWLMIEGDWRGLYDHFSLLSGSLKSKSILTKSIYRLSWAVEQYFYWRSPILGVQEKYK